MGLYVSITISISFLTIAKLETDCGAACLQSATHSVVDYFYVLLISTYHNNLKFNVSINYSDHSNSKQHVFFLLATHPVMMFLCFLVQMFQERLQVQTVHTLWNKKELFKINWREMNFIFCNDLTRPNYALTISN